MKKKVTSLVYLLISLSLTIPVFAQWGSRTPPPSTTVSPGGSTNDAQYKAGSSTFGGVTLGANTALQGTAGAPQALTLPNCPDTGGNHWNYDNSAHTLSCGTSGASSSPTIYPIPSGYTGPTIRTTSNSSQAPVIMHPSSGAGTATMTFNAASQGNCQVGDEMFFFLSKSGGTITNASGTVLDRTSFSNGQTETWHQTQAASTSVVFSDGGNNIWNGLVVCVIPGARGGPVLVDQHNMSSAVSSTNYSYLENSASQLTGTQLQELHIVFTQATCAASCAANNSTIFPQTISDAANGVNGGEAWRFFPIIDNDTNNGSGETLMGTYRKDDAKEPQWQIGYVGAAGGSGNDQIANIVVY